MRCRVWVKVPNLRRPRLGVSAIGVQTVTALEMVAWETRVDIGWQFLGEIVPAHQESDLDVAEQSQGAGSCCWMGFWNGKCGSVHTSSSGRVAVKACGSIHSSGSSFI